MDHYDHQVLEIGEATRQALFTITYPEAIRAINGLKEKIGGSALFGNENDESFLGSLATIYQTFGGAELYPSGRKKRLTCCILW